MVMKEGKIGRPIQDCGEERDRKEQEETKDK